MTAYLNTVTIKRLVDIIVIILIILVIRKKKIKLSRKGRKNLLIGIVVLVIVLEIGISLLEIKFLTFKNLRWAFVYNFPEYKLKESVELEDSGFVIFEKNQELAIMNFRKKHGNWKYKNPFYQQYNKTNYKGYTMSSNKISDQSIYLILIQYPCLKKITISDNYDSKFIFSKTGLTCYQYTTLENPVNGYYIMFENEKYNLSI